MEHFLTPLSTQHTSYIKNTHHFLSKIRTLKLEEPCFLFTVNVCNLYTNIEILVGLGAIQRVQDRHPDPNRPDDCLMRLLEISLTRNNFVFQNKFYLQVKGTAMGEWFAPAYSNIYMTEWEEESLKKCKLRPLIYLMYLDDIWGIWTHSKMDFDGFVGLLNEHQTSIKVEATLNDIQTIFLVISIFKGLPTNGNTGHKDVFQTNRFPFAPPQT